MFLNNYKKLYVGIFLLKYGIYFDDWSFNGFIWYFVGVVISLLVIVLRLLLFFKFDIVYDIKF